MTLSRRGLLGTSLGLCATSCASIDRMPSEGPARFKPTWDSLVAGYQTPDWFRDAKFGIWFHWGPQCVPEFGDWYGRLMYIQGNPFYEHHVKTYGHPSDFGFIDFIDMWKGDNWDPEGLLDLYQAAGARYIMVMANHHDNFDLWDSRHHAWNSTRVGPKRDIVATVEGIVRRRGLRFGVSNHAAHAWHWWQTAYGYDAEGPRKGARYDAYGITTADGAGKGWEDLDPQQLYVGPSFVPPDGIDSIEAMNAWHDARDGQWIETPPPHDPAFTRSWELRQRDLVDRFKPDLVYFDNYGLPLGQSGLDATAYFYNASLAWRGELPVVNGKRLDERQRKGITDTVERGFSDVLRPEPWQTDTCIGDWHYNRARYTSHYYVPAKSVVQRLIDTVSKNGNLMLNIPLRGDGSIDGDERKILEDIAAWMKVGSEGIFETRPWKIYGEGPTRIGGGMHGESSGVLWTAQDIRFTTKGDILYAYAMEWPEDGRMVIPALADRAGRVERVELLGATEPLTFVQTAAALTITLPSGRPVDFAPAVRLRGAGLI
jgi:alpha-L-fucosidase